MQVFANYRELAVDAVGPGMARAPESRIRADSQALGSSGGKGERRDPVGRRVSGHRRIRISDLHFGAAAFTWNSCLFSYTEDILKWLAVPANSRNGRKGRGGWGYRVRPLHPSRSPLPN